MKDANKLKECDLEPQFEELIRGLLQRVPSLKVESMKRDARLAPSSPDRPDWLIQARAGERRYVLVVEGKKLAHPREVRASLLQLERYLTHLPGNAPRYGVLLAPFIS